MKKRTSLEAISAECAAKRLGVCSKTVREQIRSGDLRAIRVGKQFRILLSDLDRYIRERETRTAVA